jgi:hypothetical protein
MASHNVVTPIRQLPPTKSPNNHTDQAVKVPPHLREVHKDYVTFHVWRCNPCSSHEIHMTALAASFYLEHDEDLRYQYEHEFLGVL